jgi:hypothetical protein
VFGPQLGFARKALAMEELLGLRMFAGGFGGGIDVTALIAFLAFAAFYLAVPLLGYGPERPAALAASLYLMIGYAGLSLMQLLLTWIQVVDGNLNVGQFGRTPFAHFQLLLGGVKQAVFLIAMITFVSGLRSLRFRGSDSEEWEAAADKLQHLVEENARLRKRLAEGGDTDDVRGGRR